MIFDSQPLPATPPPLPATPPPPPPAPPPPPPPPAPPKSKRRLPTDTATQPKARQRTKHDNWTEKTKHSIAKLQLIRDNASPPAGLSVIAVAHQDHIPILDGEHYLKVDPEGATHAPTGKWSVWPYKSLGAHQERRIEYNGHPDTKIKGRQVRLTDNTVWSAVHINNPNAFAGKVVCPTMPFPVPIKTTVATVLPTTKLVNAATMGDELLHKLSPLTLEMTNGMLAPQDLTEWSKTFSCPVPGKEEEQLAFKSMLMTQSLQEKVNLLVLKLQAQSDELRAKNNELQAKNNEIKQLQQRLLVYEL